MESAKNKIKLIALDLDGTLLNSDKEIGEYTKEILSSLINDGVNVILSSGRGFEGIKIYNEILNNNNDSIVFNGASIVDSNGNIIYKKTIDEQISKDIVSVSKNHDICMHIFSNNDYIISKERFHVQSYMQRIESIKKTYGLENISNYNMEKILLVGNRDILENLRKEIDNKFCIHTCFSGEYYLEVVHKDVNKGNALEYICSQKGIKREEVIAFGDNYNDIEMIEFAGVGVAMKNSDMNIKNIANYITDENNDEDGVGKFLKKFLNI